MAPNKPIFVTQNKRRHKPRGLEFTRRQKFEISMENILILCPK